MNGEAVNQYAEPLLRDVCVCVQDIPSRSSLISLAAWIPSSFKFFSMSLERATAALSSADMAQPIFGKLQSFKRDNVRLKSVRLLARLRAAQLLSVLEFRQQYRRGKKQQSCLAGCLFDLLFSVDWLNRMITITSDGLNWWTRHPRSPSRLASSTQRPPLYFETPKFSSFSLSLSHTHTTLSLTATRAHTHTHICTHTHNHCKSQPVIVVVLL